MKGFSLRCVFNRPHLLVPFVIATLFLNGELFGLRLELNQQAIAQQANRTPTATAKVVVYPLAYGTTSEGKKIGLCHPIPISVGGSPAGEIRVGIIESRISGTGLQWRSAAWQASLTACQLLGFNPQAAQTLFTVEGNIDGPSAGALLTVGILAAVRGDKLNDDVTMTGTINPDGMIGPVGGIQYKLKGAADAGKKTVLIPVHDRYEYDAEAKKAVDLIEHGKTLGVTVIPVNDIWTAYEKFTGKALPRAKKSPLPGVSKEMSKHVIERIPVWTNLYKTAKDKYKSWPDYARSEYTDKHMSEADQSLKRVGQLMTEGAFAAAYWDAVYASLMSWAAHEVGRYRYTYQLKGKEAALALMKQDDWLTKKIDTTAAAMRFYKPQTMDQLSIYLSACSAFYEGLSYYALANVLRNNMPQNEDKAAAWAVAVAEQHAIAWIDMKLAIEFLELADRYKGKPIPSNAPIEELTKFYLRSGEAGMQMVNALEVNHVAKKYGLSNDAARGELALRDPAYAVANMTTNLVLPLLPKYFGKGDQLRYARLAAATSLYTRSAMLVCKYYSLGVELDENYFITGMRRERAFKEWLDDSEDQAIRSISALNEAGVDTTTCQQILSIAQIYEGRDLHDRIESLAYYFETNVTAQVLQRLAEKTKPSAP